MRKRKISILIPFLLVGCASSQSARMLNERSEYDNPALLQQLLLKEGGVEGFKNSPVPIRTSSKIAAIYIHRTETPTRDYFWGAWLSTEIEPPQWVLTKPNKVPFAPVTSPKLVEPAKNAKK